jgi:hypothetical protein
MSLAEAPVIHKAPCGCGRRNGCSRGPSVVRTDAVKRLVHNCGEQCGHTENLCKTVIFRRA